MLQRIEWEEADDTKLKRKHFLPDPVTTPRRGPLLLRGGGGEEAIKTQKQQLCDRLKMLPRKPAKNSLTRFPVAMLEHPLEQIEADLGHLSCASLHHSVHCMLVSLIITRLLS